MGMSSSSIFRGLVALGLSLTTALGADPSRRLAGGDFGDGSARGLVSIRNEGGNWWLADTDNRPFFSLGVCSVNRGLLKEGFDPENPGYAAWQHYKEPVDWANATLKRLKSWGFSTVGAWSDYATLKQSREMTLWITPVLHIGSTAGAPWWDMWDPKVIARMDETARKQIMEARDDPRLIGYYTDNELGWWNATLFKMTLEQPGRSKQRQRLVKLLRDTYKGDWEQLDADFEAEHATSWLELQRGGMLYLRPGGKGIHVMRKFLGLLADRYYELTRQIIRKYDSRALILGDRYQSFYYPEVARAAAKYVDAISSNLNATWNDGTFSRSYLDTLHALTGKPIVISELYASAMENRSGNKNSQGGFPVVRTQKERAEAFGNTLAALLELPYVIGADWFQYSDEPRHGREDGENFNFGLVDIHDQPYTEVTAVIRSLRIDRLKGRAPRPDARNGIPRAPADPMGGFKYGEALGRWDRDRGFVKPVTEFAQADLYACWNGDALYLGMYAKDIIEDAYYRNRSVPKGDRPVWTVQAGTAEPIRARLGAGREPIVNDPTLRLENLSGLNLNVRNLAVLEVPAKRLGREKLADGDKVKLEVTLLSHCQAYRVDWKGEFRLKDYGKTLEPKK